MSKEVQQQTHHASADAILASKAKTGYHGRSTVGAGRAVEPPPRIVLPDDFGQEDVTACESSAAADLSVTSEVEPFTVGLAGRYVDKIIIVSGGAMGIGEGCVRVFMAAGANVVFCDKKLDDSKKLEAELNANDRHSGRAFFVQADVSNVDQCINVVRKTIEEFGRLDCVINNAGWHPPPGTIDDFSVADMQDLFQLNFVSYFAICKEALPHLRKTKGNIINMSSFVGAFGQAEAVTYAATKGATTAFTKALAIDEAKHGVRVNSVSPGNIWTPLWKAWSDGEADPVAAAEAGDRVQCMKRKGTIEETGRLCLCIAADMSYTTGIDHIQSGGAELGYGVRS